MITDTLTCCPLCNGPISKPSGEINKQFCFNVRIPVGSSKIEHFMNSDVIINIRTGPTNNLSFHYEIKEKYLRIHSGDGSINNEAKRIYIDFDSVEELVNYCKQVEASLLFL